MEAPDDSKAVVSSASVGEGKVRGGRGEDFD
jgi:hypothetical protein